MKGWYNDSYRHGLASKGIKTKEYWRSKYPELVKPFPGENPSMTANFVRFRQEDPKKFTKFRTKVVSPGKQVVLGKSRKSGEFELQSVMIAKNNVNRKSMSYKVVQDGSEVGSTNDFNNFRSMSGYNHKAGRTIVYDDMGNIVFEW